LFDTLRRYNAGATEYPGVEREEQTLVEGEHVTESVTMRNPKDGVMTELAQQAMYPRTGGKNILRTVISELIPIEGTQTKKGGRIFVPCYTLEISGERDNATIKFVNDTLKDDNPEVVRRLLQNINHSIPLSNRNIVDDGEKKGNITTALRQIGVDYEGPPYYGSREILPSKEQKQRLEADAKRYQKIQAPPNL